MKKLILTVLIVLTMSSFSHAANYSKLGWTLPPERVDFYLLTVTGNGNELIVKIPYGLTEYPLKELGLNPGLFYKFQMKTMLGGVPGDESNMVEYTYPPKPGGTVILRLIEAEGHHIK